MPKSNIESNNATDGCKMDNGIFSDKEIDITSEPIAIIGANCQLPGVDKDIDSLEALHNLLVKKEILIKEVPKSRWDTNEYSEKDDDEQVKRVSPKGGFLEDPSLFDADFFNIPHIEAKQMDPQHRLFLEVAIRAINDANITLESLNDSNTGVYCGLSTNDYSNLKYRDKLKFDAHSYISCADSAPGGRLAYFLNLKGPTLSVDTACSSSLSALYLATTALRNYQCDLAIVGGVHLNFSPEVWVSLSKANMLSAVGESKSFDKDADGFVRSEGCAVVILKRLNDALCDKNKIYAVAKSVFMNQDGQSTKLIAPNLASQISMHKSVLEAAKLSAKDIDYIETHGTGTTLGDSVELQAIHAVHESQHTKDKSLVIGALKTNLGHTISASGLTALLKVINTFKKEEIPANLHNINPTDPELIESIPAIFPAQTYPFPRNDNKKRYAQISNFGFTGTNVSVILEEPPKIAKLEYQAKTYQKFCFIISANSETSLKNMLEGLLVFLQKSTESLSDICNTLINCRDHYKYRCAIITKDKNSLIQKIISKAYEFKKVKVEKEITYVDEAKDTYRFFLAGANIKLNSNKTPFNPVDLPLYIFDRKPYWHNNKIAEEKDLPQNWTYLLDWEYKPINKNSFKSVGGSWLFIGESSLNQGLREYGIDVVLEQEQYNIANIEGIIFVDGFGKSRATDIELCVEEQKNKLKKILSVIKDINNQLLNIRLIFITANNNSELMLDSSPLYGFCKTLALELPKYKTTLIEVDKTNYQASIEQIISELKYNHDKEYEHIIAYREGRRLVPRLKTKTISKDNYQLSANARYLITGGCGGLGLVTAQALLAKGAKDIVLVSRNINTPAINNTIAKLREDFPDSIITPISADISNKENVSKLLLAINHDRRLKGVVHAAGIGINKPLLEHQEIDVDLLFEAKVKGGWYLHELTLENDLDFFVVYSSISSVFGSNKESVYSATNSFLDALIHKRKLMGLVGTSIQWGPWADVGMSKARARAQSLQDALINNEYGQAFIEKAIHSKHTHLAIIPEKYLRFMLEFVPEPKPAFYNNIDFGKDIEAFPFAIENCSSWQQRYYKEEDTLKLNLCKELVANICKDLLEVEENEDIDEDLSFFDFGLDSLIMTELAASLKKELKPIINIPPTIAFSYPSIEKLARYIHSKLSENCELKTPVQGSSRAIKDFASTNIITPTLNRDHNEEKLNHVTSDVDDSIAIIGMSCQLPNAPDASAFAELLEYGKSGIRDIPIERWDNRRFYSRDPDAPGKTYVNKMGYIDKIKSFDPLFFGISPREARQMDPQQRLFLANCYHAFEDANYPLHAIRGSSTGVYVGINSSHEYYGQVKTPLSQQEIGLFALTGRALNTIPGRVAYTFDLKGPALSIDTACSSSLVAVHNACNSLRNKEIDYALAGGVNVILRPIGFIYLAKAKALSPDGQCKTFDKDADGYARAEGCGVLLLKRTSDALRDNDNILAVIKGSAINNDGRSAGLTVPNGKSQEEVMQKALTQSKLKSDDINYVEVHGTGTQIGDPIEVEAINEVYGKNRAKDNSLYIGTCKTNIGHLESAAGVTGLIKTIISLQKNRIYKNLNFTSLNPKIILDNTQIALENQNWPRKTKLKTAGVSAFGFSGTNAHVILQEPPRKQRPIVTQSTNACVLVLSAKNKISLENLINRYVDFLAKSKEDFSNICYTAATCRNHFSYRIALVAENSIKASELLRKGKFVSTVLDVNALELQTNYELQELITGYLSKTEVDWVSYFKSYYSNLSKIKLPTYPFLEKEYWLDLKELETDKNKLSFDDDDYPNKITTEPTEFSLNLVDEQELSKPEESKITQKDNSFLHYLQQQTQRQQKEILIKELNRIVSDVLELNKQEQTEITNDLFAMGMDSLMSLEIKNKIQDKLQCPNLNLPIEYFINDARIDKIASKIAKKLQEFFKNPTEHMTLQENGIGAINLSNTQYGFWIVNYLSYSYNCAARIYLSEQVTIDLFAKAIALTINSNDVFWLNFEKDRPIQTLKRQGQFNLVYEDKTKSTKDNELNEIFTNNANQYISLQQQPLIRVYLYKLANELHELQIIIPHIIMDEESICIFIEKISKTYENLLTGKKQVSTSNDFSYLDYINNINHEYESNLRDKIDFWSVYNKGVRRLSFGKHYHLQDAAKETLNLYNHILDIKLLDAFKEWHQKNNKNFSTGIIAATQIVFYKLSQQAKIPIQVTYNGRDNQRYRDILGLFMETKSINISISPNYTFKEFLTSIENEFIKVAPYQKCPTIIKTRGFKDTPLDFSEHTIKLYKKLFLSKKMSKNHQLYSAKSYYLNRFLEVILSVKYINLKEKINKVLGTNLHYLKPKRLMVCFNIAMSFSSRQNASNKPDNSLFSGIDLSKTADIGISNKNLRVFFTKDTFDQSYILLNGPLTQECKMHIASELQRVMSKVVENDQYKIKELI